jgi:hypothetical protein
MISEIKTHTLVSENVVLKIKVDRLIEKFSYILHKQSYKSSIQF